MTAPQLKVEINNPVLIGHKIGKIVESIKTKIREIDDPANIQSSILDPLLVNCTSDNIHISSTAFQSLVHLVEAKYLKCLPAVSEVVSKLGAIKNYISATTTISAIFREEMKLWEDSCSTYNCKYSLQAPQHPLITILLLKPDTWRHVIRQMTLMLRPTKSEYIQNYLSLLRPVFIYVVCNPTAHISEACKHQAWHLLIHSEKSTHLQLEIIEWLRSNESSHCTETSSRILELIQYALEERNEPLCTALLPLVASLALDSIKYNTEPGDHFAIIESMVDDMDESVGSIVIFMLAEMMTTTSNLYLEKIIQIGVEIIEKGLCNRSAAYAFLAATIPWMAYATIMIFDSLKLINDRIIPLMKQKNHWPKNSAGQITSNPFYDVLHRCHSSYYFYANIVNNWESVHLNKWLEKLLECSRHKIDRFYVIIGGILLQSKSSSSISICIKIILKICKNAPELYTNALTLLLYKLSNCHDIEVTKEILYTIPDFAVSKENMPAIMGMLDSLVNQTKPPLMYVAVELYLRVWKIEPRCHPHFVKAMVKLSQDDSSFMATVTCAQAIRSICEERPENGVEFVRLLSEILNRCSNNEGSTASALALRAISALCNSGIADANSTWQMLSSKFREEKRTVVIRSICEFFGDIPASPRHNDTEFEEIFTAALTKLFQFACSDNLEVVEEAYKALAAYNIDQIKVSHLPRVFTSALKHLTAETDSNKSVENWQDEYSYIPEDCWIKMLNHHANRRPALSMAADLLSKFMSDELYAYRSGIYMWPMGEPINYKYLPNKSVIRTIGEYLRRYKSETDHPQVVVECLRIFSKKYLKALPPIQFKCLLPVISISDETKAYGMSLVCHQAAISPSAKEYLSQYLADVSATCGTMNIQEFKTKCWSICTHLQDVCRGIISTILEPFLEAATSYIVKRALVDNEDALMMLSELLEKFAQVLRDDLAHHDNKTLIANILQKILHEFDFNNKICENIFTAILELPTEQVERITSSSVWDELTDDILKKAIEIRAGLVLTRNNEIPLSWLNPILQCLARLSSRHASAKQHLLRTIRRVLTKLRDEKSCAAWCWDLMCQIQALLVPHDGATIEEEAVEFLSDVLFITIIVLSSTECLLIHDDRLDISHGVRAELFPYAVQNIVQQSFWKEIIHQVIEWLHIMRTSVLPSDYRSIFHNALTALKNEPYLYQNWTKYCSVRISFEDH